ncbi:MAG: CPBP family intramembrane glutamate endopeptidase, partial [Sulfurihydrogenibium azorense]
MKTYTTPLLLYTGLLLSVILNKYYNISFLTPLILLIPLLFVDLKNLNLISKWSLSLLCTVPFIFFQDLYSTLNQLSIA